jgi:hypothetical protein
MDDAGFVRVPARAVTSPIEGCLLAGGLPDTDVARCAQLTMEADLNGAARRVAPSTAG